jgi:flagellar basal body P-ring formation protein FlgA
VKRSQVISSANATSTPRTFGLGWMLAVCAGLTPLASHAVDPVVQQVESSMRTKVMTLAKEAASHRDVPKGTRIEVEVGNLDPRLQLAPCKVIQPYLPPGLPAWGRTRIGLKCIDGPKAWNVSLPIVVHVYQTALVLRDSLPGGTELNASQLTPAEVDVAASPDPAVLEMDQAVGRTLARPLAAGSTLRTDDLKPRQWFAAGEMVRVVAEGPGWQISTQGMALNPGIEGRLIRVKVDSGKLIVGRAVSEGTVEVNM